jgi:hypothetical protein
MGCCSSKGKVLDIMMSKYGATLAELELTRKAHIFFDMFQKHDEGKLHTNHQNTCLNPLRTDDSGTMDLVELLDLVGMSPTSQYI